MLSCMHKKPACLQGDHAGVGLCKVQVSLAFKVGAAVMFDRCCQVCMPVSNITACSHLECQTDL